MRRISFLLSLCLHLGLVLAILFWPAPSSRVRLDVPVYQVKLVSMSGKPPAGKSVAAKPPQKTAPASPAPKPEAQPPQPESKPEPKPEVAPVPVPEKAPAPKPAPTPVPNPDATPISPKKAEQPAPQPKPEKTPPAPETPKAKPEVKKPAEPKTEKSPKAEPKTPPKPKKPEPSADDILRDALASTSKEVKKAEKVREQANARELSRELAALQEAVARDRALQEALGDIGEEGVEGAPSDGVIGSIEDMYALAVQKLVKDHWRFPQMATRQELVARVRIRVGQDGAILDASVVSSSGRPDFDASALRAVADTRQLPKPPTPDIDAITVNFNSQE